MQTIFRGVKVEIEISLSRTGDPVDAVVEGAWYVNSGNAVPDSLMEALETELAGEIQDYARQEKIENAADFDWDLDR